MSKEKMIGNDLTQGSVSKTLLSFTVPFLVANVLQTLYSIVDLFIVGRYTDTAQLSGVSISSLLMMMINSLLMGLGTGGTVAIGQFMGAKRDKDARETVSACFVVYPVFALVLLVLAMAFRRQFLGLINTPEDAFAYAEVYMRVCLFGLVFTGVFQSIAAVLRGMGDSKGPTIFVGTSCMCNIVGDYVLVKVLGLGAFGAALATTVSQGISVLIGFIYLRRIRFPWPRSFAVKRDKFSLLMRLGLPVAAQETLITISFLGLETILNGMGSVVVAAAGVCDRIFNVAVVPASAFSGAIAAMVAQNEGAGAYDRSRKCLGTGLAFSAAVGVAIFLVMALLPRAVIGLFSPDSLVVAAGVEYMAFYKVDYLLCSIAFCLNGYINGVGSTRFTMYENLVCSLLIRLPLIYFVSRVAGVTLYEIGMCLPVATIAQIVLCVGFLLFAKSERERRRQLHAN